MLAPALVDVHPSSIIDPAVKLGSGTRIWHFTHVMTGAVIGSDCMIGQGCFIAGGAVIGDRVRLQNHVNVFEGVVLEDDVFCGPGVVFTNVERPRANVSKKGEYRRTLVRRGATLGANATLLPGVTIGEYAFVGAGATVNRDVAPFSLVVGVPAAPKGWVSRNAERLEFGADGRARCPTTGEVYALVEGTVKLLHAPGS
jgi:UDP-2-acetamido-3-amino-2,3-dideoxy-glucuronate N-acetyltransferase